MATGDIVQAVGWTNSGATTVGVSSNETGPAALGSDGPDAPWATPTSGNTLVVMLSGAVTVSSFTGWTLRHSYTAGTYPRYIYSKVSDGTESTITVTLSALEGMTIGVWEIEGEVTFDVASSGETASGTSVSSGTTATLAASTSVAIAFAHQWAANTNMAFTNSFVEDFDWASGTYGELYYLGGAHKAISGTTGVETTASWTGTEYGTCMVAVFSVAASATATPNDLTATSTFPSVTVASNVNASKAVTALPVTGTFASVTVLLDQTPTPTAAYGLVTFPTVTAFGSVGATPTLTALPVTASFPTAVPEAINGTVTNPAALPATGTFPTVTTTGVQNRTVTPTTHPVTGTFPTAAASGGVQAQSTLTALTVTATLPAVTVTGTITATRTATAFAVTATFPAASPFAADLSHYFNSTVTVAIEIGFANNPLTTSPTWSDITSLARGFTITRGRGSELDEYAAGVATILVDNNNGEFDPTNSNSPYYPNVVPMRQLRIRVNYGSVTYTLFRGFVEAWPMTIHGMTDETVTIRAVDGFKVLALIKDSTPQVAENSATRVGHLLNEAGWPAAWRTIGTGAITVPEISPECSTSLQLIRTIKDSEAGQFYIAANGYATFRNRTYRAGLTSQATFGPSSGEVPYQGITLGYDDSQIWNRIEVFIGGFPSYSSSTASQDKYGIRHLTINDIQLPNTTDGDDLADVYRNRYALPKERIETLTLQPEASPALLWPQVLGRDLSDKVTVKYVTQSANTKTAVSFIESINHQVSLAGRWRTTWKLTQFQ